MNKVLSDERLGAKLRVTENRCVLFNSLTYVYLALLPQHRALYAKVDSTPTFIYIYIYKLFLMGTEAGSKQTEAGHAKPQTTHHIICGRSRGENT